MGRVALNENPAGMRPSLGDAADAADAAAFLVDEADFFAPSLISFFNPFSLSAIVFFGASIFKPFACGECTGLVQS